jgi:hypothetical protein
VRVNAALLSRMSADLDANSRACLALKAELAEKEVLSLLALLVQTQKYKYASSRACFALKAELAEKEVRSLLALLVQKY